MKWKQNNKQLEGTEARVAVFQKLKSSWLI